MAEKPEGLTFALPVGKKAGPGPGWRDGIIQMGETPKTKIHEQITFHHQAC
jgi:hypothetical protein